MGLLRNLACVAALVSCVPAEADEIVWGVNGHPLVSYPGVTFEEQLDYVVDLGLKSYRVDVNSLDKLDGLDRLLGLAEARGVEILPVLVPPVSLKEDSAKALYDQAYKFGYTTAKRFRDRIDVFELGNELENYAIIQPCEQRDNGKQYPCEWGPAGGVSPLDYYGPRWSKVSAVLKGLSHGVADAAPDALRAMGTAGWGHTGAFDRMAADGVAWDISVWHIYSDDEDWAFEKLAAWGKPIWITEFNHPNGSKDGEAEQAAGLVAMMDEYDAKAALYGIEAAHIYELMDETYWAPHYEAYMGLVGLEKDGGSWRAAGPKPAYLAVKSRLADGGEE